MKHQKETFWSKPNEAKTALWASSGQAEFFFQLVKEELEAAGETKAVLDIGCGGGFLDRFDIQKQIIEKSGAYYGIEPDKTAKIHSMIQNFEHATLETATIAPDSIDLAYATMVLEHVSNPKDFYTKLQSTLKPGGVFLGFTVDARHWFSKMSFFMQHLRVKDIYLNSLRGTKGLNRYNNYPTRYLTNTPKDLETLTASSFTLEYASLHKIGQLDFYIPGPLQRITRRIERYQINKNLPGSVLVVKLTKPN
jgi:2-polyprenyl-3-methyl-5-hydroxy-6-metoxy-1,4-benzoquinol methylase